MNQEKITEYYKLIQLEELLGQIEDDVAEVIENNNIKESKDNINFLLNTLGKSILTTREVIMLCWSGYPDGALSLARNVFEQFVHVAYIECNNGKKISLLLDKYNDDYTVQRAKALKFEAEKVTCSEEKVEKYNEQLKSIKEKYKINNLRDYWWSDVNNFSRMCDVVAEQSELTKPLVRLMHFIYKRACLSIHSSCMGNKIRLGSDIPGIDMGPWETGQESSLFLVTSSLIYIVGCIYEMLDIEYEGKIKELNDYSMLYHNYIKNKSDES